MLSGSQAGAHCKVSAAQSQLLQPQFTVAVHSHAPYSQHRRALHYSTGAVTDHGAKGYSTPRKDPTLKHASDQRLRWATVLLPHYLR